MRTFIKSIIRTLTVLVLLNAVETVQACSHGHEHHHSCAYTCVSSSANKTLASYGITIKEVLNFSKIISKVQIDHLINGPNTGRNYKLRTVVIDPGHGGKDAGCKGATSSYEKNLTLEYGLMLGELIESKYPDINVIYTRKKDVFVELHERANIANRNKADLFISIHCNWNPNTSPFGTETYVLGLHRAKENLEVAKRENSSIFYENDYEKNYDGFDPDSPEGNILMSMSQNIHIDQSISLADKIEKEFANKSGRKSRGVRQAGFLVLRRTAMPAVLIETGFLSNTNEESYMTSTKGKKEIVKNIFNGFENYKRSVEFDVSDLNYVKTKEATEDVNTLASNDNEATMQVVAQQNQTLQRTKKTVNVTEPNDTDDMRLSKNVNKTAITTKPTSSPTESDVTKPSKTIDHQTSNSANANREAIEYCVQLMTTSKIQDMTDAKWQQFPNMIARSENNMFKYQAVCYSKEEAENIKNKARNNGFPEAFVCVYKDGARITFEEAASYANK